jgi:hypothetical protein
MPTAIAANNEVMPRTAFQEQLFVVSMMKNGAKSAKTP